MDISEGENRGDELYSKPNNLLFNPHTCKQPQNIELQLLYFIPLDI